MNKKLLFLFIIFIFFISCFKNNPQKQTLTVGYAKDFINTFDGKLLKNIIISYFKENNYKYYTLKSYSEENIFKSLENNEIQFLIGDYKEKEGFFSSDYLFSKSIYFLTNEKNMLNSKNFDFTKKNVGIYYDYEIENYIKNNFSNITNPNYCENIELLITDFNNNKYDLIVIDRKSYYKYKLLLSNQYLFFINYGSPYIKIFFSKKEYKDLFDIFIKNKNIKENEWIDFL
ncbi:MAG: hypothetical protein A2Y34_10840 [Spirochaetes bacterium GWC1_27_15]|nr:MAG: hypothetical protein A2Z98_04500 [Spirochaetes bacterium GWB1_27_13]OHD25406.1 MAG: hypothetical protein A2Y34_10840 [Spirochaetes bacterium GWC1_27_15]